MTPLIQNPVDNNGIQLNIGDTVVYRFPSAGAVDEEIEGVIDFHFGAWAIKLNVTINGEEQYVYFVDIYRHNESDKWPMSVFKKDIV